MGEKQFRSQVLENETADCFQSAVLNFNFAYSPLPIMNFNRSATRLLVAPFVVIPAHQLEKALVQFDARAGVEDGGRLQWMKSVLTTSSLVYSRMPLR